MAEQLNIPVGSTKKEKYEAILPQIEALIQDENDIIANLANITAVLKEAFGFFWAGFYLVKDNELVLGPFQGPLACTRIKKGRGVCGTAWEQMQTIVVSNVDEFPGHIACSSLSKSEIVVPICTNEKEVWAILDIDSDELNTFDETDRYYLEQLCIHVIAKKYCSYL